MAEPYLLFLIPRGLTDGPMLGALVGSDVIPAPKTADPAACTNELLLAARACKAKYTAQARKPTRESDVVFCQTENARSARAYKKMKNEKSLKRKQKG